MTYTELQEKVALYDAVQHRKNNIQGFARDFAAAFPVIGSLLVGYGIAVSYFASPEEVQKVSVPLVTAAWSYIVDFAAAQGQPIHIALIAVGLLSSLLSILVTVLFGFLSKRYCPEPQNKSLTLKNAKALKEQFGERVKETSTVNTNALNILGYLICALPIFITMGCQISRNDVEANIVAGIFAGICYSLIFYILLFIFRGLFILPLRWWWKEDNTLYSDIHTELQLLIPQLEKEQEALKRERQREKDKRKAAEEKKLQREKEKQERLKREEKERLEREQWEREKQENLAKADVMYQEFVESGSTDINKLTAIVALGHYDASLMLVKQCFNESNSDMRTHEEQETFLKMMQGALTILERYHGLSPEMGLLQIVAAIRLCEYESADEYKTALNDLREVKQSGKLPEDYTEVCDITIRCLVDAINNLDEQEDNDNSGWVPTTIVDDTWQPPAPIRKETIYYDYRTGERLYYDENYKVVNAAGEEVAACWWE